MTDRQTPDLPQGAYDLYDQYCHGDISRRVFFDKVQRYAVGGLTVAALMSGLLPNYALAQQVAADDPRIETKTLTYQSPNGAGEMAGLLARPAGEGTHPGVLVIHENRGLNPYIEDVARRLATAGYVAFAPDALYPLGGYPGNDDDGRSMQQQRSRDEMLEDFIAGAKTLAEHPACNGSIGAVGFCFGGSMTNMLAVRMPELKAAVPFYGGWPTAEEAAMVEAPLMIQLAGLDDRVNSGWPDYEKALLAANKQYSVHVYEGVNHGFHNDTTSRYDEAAAKLAWTRTLAFFNLYLGA
ncbi:dienelactone hydrolase family protein [Parvularcula sp. LCG005]|uniref:dienelactone hydrolase family protein n=1 Tax=Parvularcula sp. LCG005 TaxID=3078805 RepID=UPI0029422B2B|nr:dienelactone hydrolase family protein [Parvularcula sp. LCG005]WOI53541.1 dienelactone hydrolase family protein [Parvularcula sp. LCG005]